MSREVRTTPLQVSVQAQAITALRWIAALPGGLVIAFLALFPLHWLVMFGTFFASSEDGLSIWNVPPETLERLGTAIVTPYATIRGGAWIAPSHRFYAGIGLSVAVALGLGATYAWMLASPEIDFDSPFLAAVAFALNIVGVAAGLLGAKELEDR